MSHEMPQLETEAVLEPSAARLRTGTPTVLCIDDDANILESLRRRFHRRGIEMLGADGGRDGYWLAVREQPDVILTDLRMPGGSGNWLIARLKSDPRTAHIPIIVLTGVREPEQAHMTHLLGADRFLTKPTSFQDLLAALKEFISVGDEV